MKRFVTFEGIDGSGKSCISKRVFERLKSKGFNVVLTWEPTDTYIGKFVQKCIKEKSDPFITSFTFIADRIQHCKQIRKWLEKGIIVLCDRYADSTYAYQGTQLEKYIKDPIKWLKDLSKNIIIPDRTFLLTIDPEVSLNRIKDRKELIPFEELSFLERVQRCYLEMSKEERFLKIDATKKIEEIVETCYKDIIENEI